MGKWSQKSYDDELLRKVKSLFTELSEKSTKDSVDHVISYETFVDSLDESNSFVKQIFEFLIKDTAHKYRKRTQPLAEYTSRHRPSLSSIFQPLTSTQPSLGALEGNPQPETGRALEGSPFSNSITRPSLERILSRDGELPYIERRLSRDANGTLFLERRLSRDASAYLSSSLGRPTLHTTNHFSVSSFPTASGLSRPMSPSSHHSPNTSNASFHPYMVRRRSIPMDFEHGHSTPPRNRPSLRRLSFLGNLRETALMSQGLERLNENDSTLRAQVSHTPFQSSAGDPQSMPSSTVNHTGEDDSALPSVPPNLGGYFSVSNGAEV